MLGALARKSSDVDVLVVLAEDVGLLPASALAEAARWSVASCPGTGLEMRVVSRIEAEAPQPPWRFVVHIAGGREGGPTIVHGTGHPGDPDLLLHYAACRVAGWAVAGHPAIDVVGP